MLKGCKKFNQPIKLPVSAVSIAEMFAGCEVFNQNLIITDNVEHAYAAISGCVSFNSGVLFSKFNNIDITGMFYNCKRPYVEIITTSHVKRDDSECIFTGCLGNYDAYTHTYRYSF